MRIHVGVLFLIKMRLCKGFDPIVPFSQITFLQFDRSFHYTYVFKIWGQPSLRNATLVFILFIENSSYLKQVVPQAKFCNMISITSKGNFDTFDTSQPLCLQEWYALRRIFEVCLLWFNETFLLCFSSFYFCRFYWIYNAAKMLQ